MKSKAHKEFDEGITKVKLLSYVCYRVLLSCNKFVVWAIFRDLCPSGSMNRLGGPKQVIIGCFRSWLGGTVSFGCLSSSAYYPGSNRYLILSMYFYLEI